MALTLRPSIPIKSIAGSFPFQGVSGRRRTFFLMAFLVQRLDSRWKMKRYNNEQGGKEKKVGLRGQARGKRRRRTHYTHTQLSKFWQWHAIVKHKSSFFPSCLPSKASDMQQNQAGPLYVVQTGLVPYPLALKATGCWKKRRRRFCYPATHTARRWGKTCTSLLRKPSFALCRPTDRPELVQIARLLATAWSQSEAPLRLLLLLTRFLFLQLRFLFLTRSLPISPAIAKQEQEEKI